MRLHCDLSGIGRHGAWCIVDSEGHILQRYHHCHEAVNGLATLEDTIVYDMSELVGTMQAYRDEPFTAAERGWFDAGEHMWKPPV
jgi:hypothetical protein